MSWFRVEDENLAVFHDISKFDTIRANKLKSSIEFRLGATIHTANFETKDAFERALLEIKKLTIGAIEIDD